MPDISDTAIESFATKLAALELTEEEGAVLMVVMQQALQPSEVEGFGGGVPGISMEHLFGGGVPGEPVHLDAANLQRELRNIFSLGDAQ